MPAFKFSTSVEIKVKVEIIFDSHRQLGLMSIFNYQRQLRLMLI